MQSRADSPNTHQGYILGSSGKGSSTRTDKEYSVASQIYTVTGMTCQHCLNAAAVVKAGYALAE